MSKKKDQLGNMFDNDPADEVEDMTDELRVLELNHETTSREMEEEGSSEEEGSGDEEECSLLLDSDLEVSDDDAWSQLVIEGHNISSIPYWGESREGVRPMVVSRDQPVLTRGGEYSLRDFANMDGIRMSSDGLTLSYQGYFWHGRPVTEDEWNRLENERELDEVVEEVMDEVITEVVDEVMI